MLQEFIYMLAFLNGSVVKRLKTEQRNIANLKKTFEPMFKFWNKSKGLYRIKKLYKIFI